MDQAAVSRSSKVIVAKFGGTSVANAEKFKKVRKIVNHDSRRRYIIVSAPGKLPGDEYKVTDLPSVCWARSFFQTGI
jgi:aspartate kinase